MARRYLKAEAHRRLCGTPAEGPSRAHYEFHRIHDGSPVDCERALHEYAWAMSLRNHPDWEPSDYPGWTRKQAHECADRLAAAPDERAYGLHRWRGTAPCLAALSGYRWARWCQNHPGVDPQAYFADDGRRWKCYIFRFHDGSSYVGVRSTSRAARDRIGYGWNPEMARLLESGVAYTYTVVAGGLTRQQSLRVERRWMDKEAARGRRLANMAKP